MVGFFNHDFEVPLFYYLFTSLACNELEIVPGVSVIECMHFFQTSLNPVRVLKQEAEEEKAETARLSSFVGAIAVGDLVKSTLGPKGMDKILVSMGRNEGQVRSKYHS